MIDHECDDCDYYPRCSYEMITANSRYNAPPCELKGELKLLKQNAMTAVMSRIATLI